MNKTMELLRDLAFVGLLPTKASSYNDTNCWSRLEYSNSDADGTDYSDRPKRQIGNNLFLIAVNWLDPILIFGSVP